MGPRIHLDDLRVRGMLQSLETLSGDQARTVMQRVGRYLVSSMQLRFRRQMGPDGQAWSPSKRARSENGQTLRNTSRLLRSLTWRAGADYAEGGTNVPYAAVHNFGIRQLVNVRAHRRMRAREQRDRGAVSVRSHPVRSHVRLMFLPARPFAGFSEDDRGQILQILQAGILDQFRKT